MTENTGAPRTCWRWAAAAGLALSVAMWFVMLPGCPSAGGGGGGDDGGCTTDAECDNEQFCDGAETCVDGNCQDAAADACTADQECDEDGNRCIDLCTTAEDCADDNLCTTEVCVAGQCGSPTAVECGEGETCNPDTGMCEVTPTGCATDGDCDDGNFCNGAETCDAENAAADDEGCVAGTNPCAAGESCDEATDACTPAAPPAGLEDAGVTPEDPATGEEIGFDELVEGEDVEITAPLPPSPTQATDEDCDCSWSTDGSGTFTPADSCTTVYTPGADDTTITVNVTCGADEATFNQGVTVMEAPVEGCVSDVDCPDDGLFCNGVETCDEATGDCVSSGDPCPEGETCDEANDECDIGECDDDLDCDDGLFCNGTETCDLTTGECVEGEDPCADTDCGGDPPVCDEGDDAAECTCPPVVTLDLSLGQDTIQGTTGDDVFNAALLFNAPGGAQVASLQTGDSVNGLAGTDLLTASFTGTETLTPSGAGVEEWELSSFGGAPAAAGDLSGNLVTLNGTNIAGATLFTSVNSTSDILVNGLQSQVDFGVRNVQNAAVDFVMQFAQATATMGTTDEIDFTVGSTLGAAAAIVPAGVNNGFETMNIISEGAGPNVITTVLHLQAGDMTLNGNTAATSLTKIDFSSTDSGSLRTNLVPNSVLTFDASGMSGNFTLGSGETINAMVNPYVPFHLTNVNISSITGGTGNDLFIFGTHLTDADAQGTGQSINGGGGTDGVQATLAANIAAVPPFVSIENLFLNATMASQVNLTGVAGITSVTIDGATGNTAELLTLLNISGSPLPSLIYRGDGTQAGQIYDPVTYNSTGTGGAGDSLAIQVNNRAAALNNTGTANVHNIGALIIPNVETLTTTVSDGPALFGGITASTLASFTGTASSNLTTGAITGGTNTITTVNLSGVLGAATVTLVGGANGMSVTGAAGNDNLTVGGSAAMTSTVTNLGNGDDVLVMTDGDAMAAGTNPSNDVITGGAGADTITPGEGNDVVTPGDGNDTVMYTSVIGAMPVNNDGADQISGFAVGDRLRFLAAPPAFLGMADFDGDDQNTTVGQTGGNTVIILDLDTDAAMMPFLTITLPGVLLAEGNFMISGNDIVRIN